MKSRSVTLRIALVASIMAIAVAVFAVTMFAHADAGPSVSVSVQNSSNIDVTTAPVGTLLHARVLVASSTSPAPEGTVDFNLYPNMSCSGTPSTQVAVALATTTGTSTASSATTTMPNAGLSYKVHYSGQQGVYPSSDSVCVAVAATAAPTISTALSANTVLAGSAVYDSATLVGLTSSATGTVAYTVYTNNSCSAGAQSAGVKTLSNGTVANSNAVTFATPGAYYWQAAYSGDQFNAAAQSGCQSEVLTVNATSTTPTTGTISVDEVTTPSNDPQSFHFTTTGSGYAGFDLADTSVPNSQVLTPGVYTISQNSVSNWTLGSAACSRNGAAVTSYTPGSNLTLNAGDTVRCVFVDTKISTSSNPNHHICNNDNDADDVDCGTATSTNNGHHGFGGFLNGCIGGIKGVAESIAHRIANTEKQITKTQTRLDTLNTKLTDLKAQQAAGVTDAQATVHAQLVVDQNSDGHDSGLHVGQRKHGNKGKGHSQDD